MITKNQVRKAIDLVLGWSQETNCPMPDTILASCTEAEDVLSELDVSNPGERVEWYNVSTLDIEDLVDLANVEFEVLACQICEEKGFVGHPEDWDKFQGVWQAHNFGPIMINDRELLVCSECYEHLDGLGQ